jgi:uncharacterized protein YjbJ (UPF0337 family)
MGIDDNLENKAEELKGEAKQKYGERTDQPDLAAEGQADSTKANLKQAGEKVKDAFS